MLLSYIIQNPTHALYLKYTLKHNHSSKTLENVCVRCATLHVSVNIQDHLQGLFLLQCYLRFVVFVAILSGHVAVLSVYVVAVCTSFLLATT
jgi:hypothetical protein